jgi:hypothetical protein
VQRAPAAKGSGWRATQLVQVSIGPLKFNRGFKRALVASTSSCSARAIAASPSAACRPGRCSGCLSAASSEASYSDANVANIVTLGVSGGRSLTRPLRDARRFPSTRRYPVPGATRTPLGFGIQPSFGGHFLPRRANPTYDFAFVSLRCTSFTLGFAPPVPRRLRRTPPSPSPARERETHTTWVSGPPKYIGDGSLTDSGMPPAALRQLHSSSSETRGAAVSPRAGS